LSADIVRAPSSPGAVTVEGLREKIEISAARSHFGSAGFSVVEFRRMTEPEGTTVDLPGPGLAEGLRQVVRAASNRRRPTAAHRVLMTNEKGAIRLVATDSYRLALRDLEGTGGLPEGEEILVPARALAELQRLSSSAGSGEGEGPPTVAMVTGPHEVTFTHGAVRISTRLLDGSYPDYRQLIPDHYRTGCIWVRSLCSVPFAGCVYWCVITRHRSAFRCGRAASI